MKTLRLRRVRQHLEVEFRAVSRRVDLDFVAARELTKQNLVRQRILDVLLDGPFQRTRTVTLIVPVLHEQLCGRIGEANREVIFGHTLPHVAQENRDNLRDVFATQRMEDDDVIKTIQEFGVEAEYIELLGVQGEVIAIELFSTTLLHADRSRVVIPNRKIVGEILHNYGHIRQLDLHVSVAYDTDLSRAIALVRETVLANDRVLKEMEPVIGVAKLADSSVTLAIKPWVKLPDYGPAVAELNQAILDRCRADGIRIPAPQREVRLINAAA